MLGRAKRARVLGVIFLINAKRICDFLIRIIICTSIITMIKSKTNFCIRVLLIIGIIGAIIFCNTLIYRFWTQISFVMILLGLLGLVAAIGRYCFDFLRRRKIRASMSRDNEIDEQPTYHAILVVGYVFGFLSCLFFMYVSMR